MSHRDNKRLDYDNSESQDWIALGRARATSQPGLTVYHFLGNGDSDGISASLTAAELDHRARAIAAHLQREVEPGARVLLLHPPGLDLVAAFFGCLYAGAAAVPCFPPRSPRHTRLMERLQAVARNAEPALALTGEAQREPMSACLTALDAGWVPVHGSDSVPDAAAERWRWPDIDGERLACLQYTSGSTGEPKGVMLSHRNLLHNSAAIAHCFGHGPDSAGVIWLPPYHDMGLIGGILQPLYAGFPVYLMPPGAFLDQPLRWLRAIDRFRATTSGGPDFAYAWCVERIPERERARLDLSSWTVAFDGAEPVQAETLERFARAYEPSGFRRQAFYPCYGLAEASLIVTGGEPGRGPVCRPLQGPALRAGKALPAAHGAADAVTAVGCGVAGPGQQVLIADLETGRPRPEGAVGEIWVAGASVTCGYWRRDADPLFGTAPDEPGRFLKTGDLGFLSDGELFVTGRLKERIGIRGLNYDPADIERTLRASHPALASGQGAAFELPAGGENRLVVLHEVARGWWRSDLGQALAAARGAISERHELRAHAILLLRPGRIPRTPGGKVRRLAARAAYLAGGLEVLAQWREGAAGAADPATPADRAAVEALERALATLVAGAVGLPAEDIDPHEPLGRYGLDSLSAANLALDLEERLGRPVPYSVFWDHPTIAELARLLAAGAAEASAQGLDDEQLLQSAAS